jgi:hypothetical protein
MYNRTSKRLTKIQERGIMYPALLLTLFIESVSDIFSKHFNMALAAQLATSFNVEGPLGQRLIHIDICFLAAKYTLFKFFIIHRIKLLLSANGDYHTVFIVEEREIRSCC